MVCVFELKEVFVPVTVCLFCSACVCVFIRGVVLLGRGRHPLLHQGQCLCAFPPVFVIMCLHMVV